MGVSEMTRFGMEEKDFQALAMLMKEAVLDGVNVTDQIKALRAPFRELRFCFRDDQYDAAIQRLHGLL